MRSDQEAAVLGLCTGKSSVDQVTAAFGIDFTANPEATVAFLEQEIAARNSDGVDIALTLVGRFRGLGGLVPQLRYLLNAEWHKVHEDVASALEDLRDPSSVEDLFLAASRTFRTLPYLESYDGGYAFARKCTWALAKIGTSEAWQKLEQLANSDDPEIRVYAMKRLARRRTPLASQSLTAASDDSFDAAAELEGMRSRTKRKRFQHALRLAPAIATGVVCWIALVASGLGLLIAALPAGIAGAAAYRFGRKSRGRAR